MRCPASLWTSLLLLRDKRQWPAALKFIDGLPEQIQEMPVVREQHALVLGKNGQPSDAIVELEALIRVAGDSSERSGLLGGRYKGLYEAAADAQSKSLYLNKAIASYERGMMLDLNDYFPSCNLPRLYRERKQSGDEEKAITAARLTVVACQRAIKRNPDDPWIRPTLLGAAFDAGDVSTARRLLDEFYQATTAPFQIDSTIPDLRRALLMLADAEAASNLAPILAEFQRLLDPNGTVTALAGRRIDAQGAKDHRFPPENADDGRATRPKYAGCHGQHRSSVFSGVRLGHSCSGKRGGSWPEPTCGASFLAGSFPLHLGRRSRRGVGPAFRRDPR